jgi:hypothetical protein
MLVKGMYAAQPDLTACSQQQVLQRLLLADRYGVPKILAAAMAAFEGVAQEDLQWGTLHALYALPPGCIELDACKAVFKAAAAKLQQELGDLELVWGSQDKEEQLLALPHSALLQLLTDPLTRVASEDTVFHTIERWHKHQQRQQQQPDSSSTRELLKAVRMMVRCFAWLCCL